MTAAVLLAGGFGTRLASVSGGKPKPLVDVGGMPFIEHVLDHALTGDIDILVLAVSYRWEMLKECLGDSYKGCPICWSVEKEPLGTGGGIRYAMDECGADSAFVLNADTLFRVDLRGMQEQHVRKNSMMTVALRQVSDASRFGAVKIDSEGVIVEFIEKGFSGRGLVNGGIYFLEKSVFSLASYPNKFSFENDLLVKELKRIRPLSFIEDAYFIDIGIPEELERARLELQGN